MRAVVWALAVGAGLVGAVTPPGVFENTNHDLTYLLAGTYAKKSVQLEVKNTGSEPVSEYFYAVEAEFAPHAAVTEARVVDTNVALPFGVQTDDNHPGGQLYRLQFPEPLGAGESLRISLVQAFTNQLKALPEYGAQDAHQFVVFNASRIPYSAYPSKSAKTTLRLLTTGMEELGASASGDNKKTVVSDSQVEYGPYKNVKPYQAEALAVRYENPKPLVKATQLDRDVWVSHWGGSLSFEETYKLVNFGTKLEAGFSRLDYLRGRNSISLNAAALKELVVTFGRRARDAYYTDLVGNVSTSHFVSGDDASALQLEPRYPIFGGWKYNFTIGWSNDLGDYVKKIDEDEYLLRVPMIEGPSEFFYDDVNINVILPEGAEDISVRSIFGQEVAKGKTFSYLDTAGRPTVSLAYHNLLDSHRRGDIYIAYKYTQASALRKPVVIGAAFAALFTLILALSKIDVTVDKKSKTE